MPDNDYVSRGKPAVGTDDSSTELGLDHAYTKGRPIVSLPPATTGYDPDLVGKSPTEMAEHLQRREDDRDGNNYKKLMEEVPGGKTPGSHSSSSGKRRRKQGSGGGISTQNVPFDGTGVVRPHPMAGRVSDRAKHGIERERHTSVGEMLNVLGETLEDGVSWAQVEYTLRELSQRKRIAHRA